MKPVVLISTILALLAGAFLLYWFYPELFGISRSQELLQVQTSMPTNYLKAGIAASSNGNLYFEGKRLIFDALSFCVSENGSVPCLAMSVTLDVPFGGKNIVLEGEESGGQILVRKLRRVRDGESPLLGVSGNTFVSWPDAQKIIEKCHAKMVMQTHALDVIITLINGKVIRSVEPQIDRIFDTTQKAQSSCGNISIATE